MAADDADGNAMSQDIGSHGVILLPLEFLGVFN